MKPGMKEHIADRHYDFKARTLANNLVWLKSFGCKVTFKDNIIHVQHANLPEYNTYLVIGSSEQTPAQIELLLADREPVSLVYVDDAASTEELRSVLASGGLSPAFISRVKMTRLTPRKNATDIELHQAQAHDVPEWSALYSMGFARFGKQAEVDRKRWQEAFKHPEIQHWFFVERGSYIGTSQTCISDGVVGVYSVTLSPGYRRVAKVIAATRCLAAEMVRRGEELVYFERISNRVPAPLSKAAMFLGFKTIRRFVAYRKR